MCTPLYIIILYLVGAWKYAFRKQPPYPFHNKSATRLDIVVDVFILTPITLIAIIIKTFTMSNGYIWNTVSGAKLKTWLNTEIKDKE